MTMPDPQPRSGSTDEKEVYAGEKEKRSSNDVESGHVAVNSLNRALKGRHMQMIAIGGAIGAGLFVGSGSALSKGGPVSLLLGYIITGLMLLLTIQALGELAVLYPVNGAFFDYICRFVDPSWGFAVGWQYALNWLIILPFEITAAALTIDFWRDDLNIGIWVAVFLVLLAAVQIFGVKGYGEVEFVLALIKIIACIGFIILGIIINCGGVPGDNRGYIGAKYWHDPGAFRNGFKGFCSVFVTAAFAFSGAELTGLAAAEAENPKKSLPKACRQTFWRIALFYVLNVFILGLIVRSDSEYLLESSGANTKASPFVVAIQDAGIKVLPSIYNAVITIAFINEANMGNDVFNWLLALAGLSNFFVWGSICLAHIRFRLAWKQQGHTLDELAYKARFGIPGSALGLFLNVLCLCFQFYVALFPIGGSPDAEGFFSSYLAAPIMLASYVGWKVYTVYSSDPRVKSHTGWFPWVRIQDIDLMEGMRKDILDGENEECVPENKCPSPLQKVLNIPKAVYRGIVN